MRHDADTGFTLSSEELTADVEHVAKDEDGDVPPPRNPIGTDLTD